MASKYDWDFIRPLDQTANIAAMAQGNQQINAGLQGIGNAVTGYADAMKQRNTDQILNTLMGAKTSAELPNAMNAVQALQQQYGRGYDQTEIRNAIDTRGSTLAQRDLQGINLQQAQAAQAAIPTLNQAGAAEAIRMGANPEQMNALAALGIDTSGHAQRYGTNAQGDARYAAEGAERRSNRAQDVAWREQQARQQQSNWQSESDFRADESDWRRGGELAAENPKSAGYAVDASGNLVTVANQGVSRMDAYGALAGVRGIRNNNPGNLGFAGQRGASRENGNGRFASFGTPEEGLGAMSKQLDLHFSGKSAKAKEAGRPLQSITDIVTAWAPPNENNTAKYIADISKQLGVSPTARLNMNDPKTKMAFMKSIVQKENGGNPYSDEQYQAGISGKVGTSKGASNAIGNVVPQAAMSKVTSGYQDSIAKATRDFAVNEATAQTKGSLAATGKNVDTWLAAKGETSITGGSDNPIFTRSADIAKMARNEPMFKALPAAAQLKVLDGAYGFVNSTGLFEYVPNAELKKFIRQESTRTKDDSKNQFNVTKKAIFEQSYQDLAQAFQASGSRPPSREAAMQLLDPQYKPKQAAQPKPQPVQPKPVAPASKASPAAQAIKATAPKVTQIDRNLADRAARKQAEFAALEKRLATKKIPKSVARPTPSTAFKLPTGATNLSQKDIDKMLKEYKVR